MLFNLFKKMEPRSFFIDKTYASLEAKKRACVALAQKDAKLLFIAWFADTAGEFVQLFEANGLTGERIIEARNLHSAKLSGHRPVFLEHYPLRAKEEALIEHWPTQQIEVYNSLEDGLLKHFGGDRIATLMKQMGMHADEVIDHPLVGKSIANAQEKIAGQVVLEQTASSQTGWMEKNLKKF